MSDFLLDCNHLSEAIRKVSVVRDRLQSLRKSGIRFGTCLPVLCELEVGIQQTAKPEQHRQRLQQLLKHVRLWPTDRETARIYGALYLELRRQGRALSQVDMILAAMARQMNLRLLTTDRDFEALPDIPAEDWVS